MPTIQEILDDPEKADAFSSLPGSEQFKGLSEMLPGFDTLPMPEKIKALYDIKGKAAPKAGQPLGIEGLNKLGQRPFTPGGIMDKMDKSFEQYGPPMTGPGIAGIAAGGLLGGPVGALANTAMPSKTWAEAGGNAAAMGALKFLPAPLRAALSKILSPQAANIGADVGANVVGSIANRKIQDKPFDWLSTGTAAAAPLLGHALTSRPAINATNQRSLETAEQGVKDISGTLAENSRRIEAAKDAINRATRNQSHLAGAAKQEQSNLQDTAKKAFEARKASVGKNTIDISTIIPKQQAAVNTAQNQLDALEAQIGPKLIKRTYVPPGKSGKEVTEMVTNPQTAQAYQETEDKLSQAKLDLETSKDHLSWLQKQKLDVTAAGPDTLRSAALESYQKQLDKLTKGKTALYQTVDQLNANSRLGQAKLEQFKSQLEANGKGNIVQKMLNATSHYAIRILPYGVMFHFPGVDTALKAGAATAVVGGIIGWDKLVKNLTAPGKGSEELSNQFGQWLEKGATPALLKAFPAVQNLLERDSEPVKTSPAKAPGKAPTNPVSPIPSAAPSSANAAAGQSS